MAANPNAKGRPSVERRQINISVDERMYSGLVKMAGERSMSPTAYAALLFEAGYAARCGFSQGDVNLDAAVARTVLLRGSDTLVISRAVGLSEATVVRILDAWRDELRAEGA